MKNLTKTVSQANGSTPQFGPGEAGNRPNRHSRRLRCLALLLGLAASPLLAAGPMPVPLGEAGHFTLLAGAAITTTGGGTVTGDAGVSPAAGSTIGVTDAQVDGIIYAVDASGPSGSVIDPVMLTTAKGDLTTAYNDAAGRTPVPTGPFLNPGFGNIGGLNLAPGLYKFTGEAHIEGSDLTLTGGPDDVWIFQVATALIMGADGRKVILAGGARAANVFWQVGTSATIGTFAEFKGTIMADQSIVLDTSSVLDGRALARIGQITFNGTSATISSLTLEIISEHGIADLPVGVHLIRPGGSLTNSVSAVETLGGTNYVATGWTMTGNEPYSGTGNTMSMVATNDAVLTWGWATNYLLDASADLNGIVTGDTNGFYAAGATVSVTAVADPGYVFAGWTGDAGASTNTALLVLLMDQARTLTAHFTPDAVTLEIVSAHGVATPPVGLYTNNYGSLLTNGVSEVETIGGTQYVATGWILTGNEPFSGTGTGMTMVHTNDAVLTWGWSTNYFLGLSAVNGAITNATEGFKPAGWAYDLSPVPDEGYRFDYWELNGLPAGTGMPLNVVMTAPMDVVAVFSPLFVDVSGEIDWSVTWVFDPRRGFYIGTVRITNPSDQTKVLRAPFWFEVERTEYHWLRHRTGIDPDTGYEYLDISAAINARLPGIGNGDSGLDPGETVTVPGIELMGRRTTDGLVMAVWADPPGAVAPGTENADTDGDGIPNAWENAHPAVLNASNPFDAGADGDADGMSNGAEYTAGTDPADAASRFVIRPRAGGQGVDWDGRPGRVYSVWASRDPTTAFTRLAQDIPGYGTTATCGDDGQSLDGDGPMIIYRVEVKVNTGETP